MIVYVLMYKYKENDFGLLDVFYDMDSAIEFKNACIRIDKKNQVENEYEYKIEKAKIK